VNFRTQAFDFPGILLPSSIGQDATLSRWRERFDSARERQQYQRLRTTHLRSVQWVSNIRVWTAARFLLIGVPSLLLLLIFWPIIDREMYDADRRDE
jgi:hypothetical protein